MEPYMPIKILYFYKCISIQGKLSKITIELLMSHMLKPGEKISSDVLDLLLIHKSVRAETHPTAQKHSERVCVGSDTWLKAAVESLGA